MRRSGGLALLGEGGSAAARTAAAAARWSSSQRTLQAALGGGVLGGGRHVRGAQAMPGETLTHDSTTGPATNPRRRRCATCGKRVKHCRCG